MAANSSSSSIRPTKKQRELLSYIEQFITEHGYSPSYREIMNGLSYTSVATVSLHVTSLIRRGHLRKRDRSARSLEVVTPGDADKAGTSSASQLQTEEVWLANKVEAVFTQAEQAELPTQEALDNLRIVVKSLELLGLEQSVQHFDSRLKVLVAKGEGDV